MRIIIGSNEASENRENLILNAENYTGSPIIVTSITGLETAPYRNGSGNWSYWDGGYMSSQFFGGREITISGAYHDKRMGCDFASTEPCDYTDEVVRYYLRSHLPIRTLLPIRFQLDNGLIYYTEGYCVGIDMTMEKTMLGEFQISFYCPEAPLYRLLTPEISSLWLAGDIYKMGTSGYPNNLRPNEASSLQGFLLAKREGANPTDPPIGQYWNAGGRGLALNYCGDYPYRPRITIKGPVVNPTIYNTTTNEWFGLGSYTNELARFTVTQVEENRKVSDIALVNNNYGGIYSSNTANLNAVSLVGQGLTVTATYEKNPTERVISLRHNPVVNPNYIGAFERANLPLVNPMTNGKLTPYNWCDVIDDGFEWQWADSNDPQVLGEWVRTDRLIGTTPHSVPMEIIDGGSGYHVGDYCELAFHNADVSTDERAIVRITSVTQEGQMLGFNIVSYGKYSNVRESELDFITITGTGSGAVVYGYTEIKELEDTYAVTSVEIKDGGAGYTRGDVVKLVQPGNSPNDVSVAEVEILETSGDGKILGIEIADEGDYDENEGGSELETVGDLFGKGATINVGMSRNATTRRWHVSTVEIVNGGTGYTAGETLQILGQQDSQFKLIAGQQVIIDCENQTVTVGGKSRSYFIRPGSKWLYLAPKTLNNFVYTSADQDENGDAAHLEYRLAFMGIQRPLFWYNNNN